MDELKEVFKNPGAPYRGKPFWAWNGKLEENELRRQVRVMHRMGLGGFFMHSRVGLATEYLSDEWFQMVEACVDEAGKLNMEAWLYDEDRWPSGAAGGLVTSDPRFRRKELQMVVCDPKDARFDQRPLALFSAVIEGNKATHMQRVGPDWDGKVKPKDAQVLAFFVACEKPSSWYNDATYLDTMDREAVQKFIEVTHAAYGKRIGKHFGTTVPGIFTDEPNRGRLFGKASFGAQSAEARAVPWTPALPEHFRKRYGYDILDHLPRLFFSVDGEELSQPRYHYYDCTTSLFVDAFARQIYEWCGKNRIMFTGHVDAEESLRSQTNVVGAAMRFYEFMQAPGVDVLTELNYEYSTVKQCASVLRQTGRKWLLSELYGCTGWDFPFEGHKAVGDWQAALGVNLRCPHLSWYTMAGQAKRDYPASIFFQSPWWEQYRKVEDYFGRVNAVMSRGDAVRKLLVIHPIESVWARTALDWRQDPKIQRLETQFDELLHWLLDGHVDFDYGDEEMLSRVGSIEQSKEPALKLGVADYSVVLVPPMDTLRSSTLSLLRRFKQAGGTVVFCGEPPAFMDCTPTEEVRAFARECVSVPFQVSPVLASVQGARVVSICDASGHEKPKTLYLLHREGGELRLFVCNTDRQKPTGPLAIAVQAEGASHADRTRQVQLWDAETGNRYALDCKDTDGALKFSTCMPPSGSRLFVITLVAERLPAPDALTEARSIKLRAGNWSAELAEPNVFVLDMPEYKTGKGRWQGPLEVLKADAQVRKAIGLPVRGGAMVQPWARPKVKGPEGPFSLRYRFRVERLPRCPAYLAIENPKCFEIALNGSPIATESECGWWVDPAIRLLPLDEAALVTGENVLLMNGTMDDRCNIEICYLLGDFAVVVDGADARIVGPAVSVKFGDWTKQGLPFYAGSVVFRTNIDPALRKGERAFVEVPEFAGACVRVLVNGQEAGIIGWRPHEVEVTDLVAGKGEVELAVEVIGHRRNAFGPLHHVQARPRWVGPSEFLTTGELWQDAYNLLPAGCMTPPRLSIRT